MERFSHRLLYFLLLFLIVRRSTSAETVQGFTLYNPMLKVYMKATMRFSRIVAMASSTATTNTLFRWQWTKDGQIQNVGNRLCIDVDTLSENSELRLCTCNFRKSFQKWRCHDRLAAGVKYYYVNPEHTRKRFSWRVMQRDANNKDRGYVVRLSSSTADRVWLYSLWGASTNVTDFLGPNICDLNHRGQLIILLIL